MLGNVRQAIAAPETGNRTQNNRPGMRARPTAGPQARQANLYSFAAVRPIRARIDGSGMTCSKLSIICR